MQMDDEIKNKIIEAQEGNQKALNELVKDNYGLVYSISRRFENRGYDKEDLNQIGAMGLIKAIKKFDFSYNVVLSTFAVTYIIGEIKRFIRDDGPIKISRELKQLATKIEIEKKNNPEITIDELASKTNESKENIIIAVESTHLIESLDEKIDNNGLSLMEKLKSNENSEEKMIERITLKDGLENLQKREKELIYLRYFKGQTQQNIAKIIGISQVQVSRLEKKALNKLKKYLRMA